MEREILFRGKRRDNGEWIIGYYLVVGGISYILPEKYFLNGIVEVVPSTVGQYTSLTDKKGKKIFEGDIVKLTHDWCDGTFDTWLAVVAFGNPNGLYSWGWQLKHISGADSFNKDILLWVDMEESGAACEIIGNIYDDFELLKGNKNE